MKLKDIHKQRVGLDLEAANRVLFLCSLPSWLHLQNEKKEGKTSVRTASSHSVEPLVLSLCVQTARYNRPHPIFDITQAYTYIKNT
jgi:hypothetical protein